MLSFYYYIYHQIIKSSAQIPHLPVSLRAPLIVLAVPFPPSFKEPVHLISFLEIDVVRESFGVPYLHVTRDLVQVHLGDQSAQPVWSPVRSVSLMVHLNELLGSGLEVMIEHHFHKRTFEENKNSAASNLNNRDVQHKLVPDVRQVDVIVDVADAQEVLLFVGQEYFFVHFLLQVPHTFYRVLEHFCHVRVVSSFPFRLP